MLLRLAQEKIRGLGRFAGGTPQVPQLSALLAADLQPVGPAPAELWSAIQRSDLKRVEELIAAKIDLSATSTDQISGLHMAAQSGNYAIACALLDAKADLVKSRTIHGDTALHLAARQGHFRIAELIIARGGDQNAANNFGQCALHDAAKRGDREVTELLLKHGADPLFPDYLGNVPAALAADAGHVKLVEFLLKAAPAAIEHKNNLGNTMIFFAAQHGSVELIRMILSGQDAEHKAGIVNAKNRRGNRPLHRAAMFGHAEACSLLLEAGAEAAAENDFGETAQKFARDYRHPDVETLLRRHVERAPPRRA